MKTIHKYILRLEDEQKIQLPQDSTILSVVEQYGQLVLYVLKDADAVAGSPADIVEVRIYGTGNPISDDLMNLVPEFTFLGTLNTEQGTLIWHVFYRRVQ